MMYLDNIIFSLQKAGGISVYWCELLKYYSSLRSVDNIHCFEYKNNNIIRNQFENNLTISDLALLNDWFPLQIKRYLPFTEKLHEMSLFHSSYYRYSNQKNVKNVTTVHDFTYEHYMKGISKSLHSLQKYNAVKNSTKVICVSENTKKDLLNFYPNYDPENVVVIHNGVSNSFFPLPADLYLEKFSCLDQKPFILFVGDRSEYKNFSLVLESMLDLPEFNLAIVGGKTLTKIEIDIIDKFKDRFFHFTSVLDSELNYLYNKAFVFLYPSSYEGFGIPILESMRAGCPVITTNFSSIPEVAGDAAIYLTSVSKDCIVDSVYRLHDSVYRNTYRELGLQQSFQFSWEKCAFETFSLYEDILLTG